MNPLQFWYWENNFNRSQLKEINKIIKEKEDKQYKDAPARTVKKVANVTGVEYRPVSYTHLTLPTKRIV